MRSILRYFALSSILTLGACGSVEQDVTTDAGSKTNPPGPVRADPPPESTLPVPAPSCTRTHFRFDARVESPSGVVASCDDPGLVVGQVAAETVLDARIEKVDGNVITFDACPQTSDCAPERWRVTVESPGLRVSSLPIGAFAHVVLTRSRKMGIGCAQHLMITSLPIWAGTANPDGPGERLYLAGADQQPAADNAFYRLEVAPSSCPASKQDGRDVEFSSFRFTDARQPARTVTVGMGQTAAMALGAGEGRRFAFHDARSYQVREPDNSGDWAYWIAPE